MNDSKRISDGDVVRGFRVMFGLSREQMAEHVSAQTGQGVTTHAVMSWETGRTEMRLNVVRAIASRFGDFEQLFWQCIQRNKGGGPAPATGGNPGHLPPHEEAEDGDGPANL